MIRLFKQSRYCAIRIRAPWVYFQFGVLLLCGSIGAILCSHMPNDIWKILFKDKIKLEEQGMSNFPCDDCDRFNVGHVNGHIRERIRERRIAVERGVSTPPLARRVTKYTSMRQNKRLYSTDTPNHSRPHERRGKYKNSRRRLLNKTTVTDNTYVMETSTRL